MHHKRVRPKKNRRKLRKKWKRKLQTNKRALSPSLPPSLSPSLSYPENKTWKGTSPQKRALARPIGDLSPFFRGWSLPKLFSSPPRPKAFKPSSPKSIWIAIYRPISHAKTPLAAFWTRKKFPLIYLFICFATPGVHKFVSMSACVGACVCCFSICLCVFLPACFLTLLSVKELINYCIFNLFK